MANHDPNHSSHQRTILWVIVPVAVGLTFLFTALNGNMPAHRTELGGAVEMKKVEAHKEVHGEVNVHLVKDTTVVRVSADTAEHKEVPTPAPAH